MCHQRVVASLVRADSTRAAMSAQIPLRARPRADEGLDAEPLQGEAHRLDMAVRARAQHLESLGNGYAMSDNLILCLLAGLSRRTKRSGYPIVLEDFPPDARTLGT